MTFRDRVTSFGNYAVSSYLNFKPDTGINWMLRNINTSGRASLEFYKVSGGLVIEIDRSIINPLDIHDKVFHCSPDVYYRVKNIDTNTIKIAADGIVSREGNIGDTLVQNIERKSAGQAVTIQPPAGEEWVIHNILFQGPIELIKVSGATELATMQFNQTNSSLIGLSMYCTNSIYWKVKHIGSGYNNIGYDGQKTLEV